MTVMELPEPICHQLLQCLVHNTSLLPVSLQHADDGFHVRFIEHHSSAANLFRFDSPKHGLPAGPFSFAHRLCFSF